MIQDEGDELAKKEILRCAKVAMSKVKIEHVFELGNHI